MKREKMENPKINAVLEYILIVLGSCVFGAGIVIFIKPSMISMGGVAGMALIGNYLTGLPLGMASIILNVPLFIFGYKLLGRQFFWKTIVSSVSYSVFIDLVGSYLPLFTGDRLLAALYGGLIMGLGFGLVFKRGGTSGGTDIISKYLNEKFEISIGNANLVMNGMVIIACSVIYKSVESALYAIIVQYLTGVVLNAIVDGSDRQKEGLIITSKPEEMAKAILENLQRGCTGIEGKGMYTNEEKTLLLVVVRRHEISALKKLAHQVDPECFMLVSEVSEVFGVHFKQYAK